MVLQEINVAAGIDHPMHLYGYNFFIVGTECRNFDKDKDPLTYNLIDPPFRNTAMVPKDGWVTIWFTTNNPVIDQKGLWGIFFGLVIDLYLSPKSKSRRSCYVFVWFATREEAERVAKVSNGMHVYGWTISSKVASLDWNKRNTDRGGQARKVGLHLIRGIDIGGKKIVGQMSANSMTKHRALEKMNEARDGSHITKVAVNNKGVGSSEFDFFKKASGDFKNVHFKELLLHQFGIKAWFVRDINMPPRKRPRKRPQHQILVEEAIELDHMAQLERQVVQLTEQLAMMMAKPKPFSEPES
ncbi:hypothetical protein Ddye_005704 [Dipteronia dyeriana]|uniref:Plastocyanin-like domain-containing protein n=1 Tax=Dipteronia dyeriana TaxID=168575 RepID=A0AAE0CQ01_9ROSI|nr:hypothetical protein Ddye_005704 [Dipteronia dyeriana]